jgi:hypothetical protein
MLYVIPKVTTDIKNRSHLLVQLALPVRDASQANAGEEVDGEAHVGHAVSGEDAAKVLLQAGLSQPLVEPHQAHVLTQLLCTACE